MFLNQLQSHKSLYQIAENKWFYEINLKLIIITVKDSGKIENDVKSAIKKLYGQIISYHYTNRIQFWPSEIERKLNSIFEEIVLLDPSK